MPVALGQDWCSSSYIKWLGFSNLVGVCFSIDEMHSSWMKIQTILFIRFGILFTMVVSVDLEPAKSSSYH
jgi:hypothetical protein